MATPVRYFSFQDNKYRKYKEKPDTVYIEAFPILTTQKAWTFALLNGVCPGVGTFACGITSEYKTEKKTYIMMRGAF